MIPHGISSSQCIHGTTYHRRKFSFFCIVIGVFMERKREDVDQEKSIAPI